MCKLMMNKSPETWPCVLGVDLETTGLDPFIDKILTIALSDGDMTWVFTADFEQLIPVLVDPDVVKIFHNATFDCEFIKVHLGIVVQNIYCTLLAERVIHNGNNLPNSLYDVLSRRLGILLDKSVREGFINHPRLENRPITLEELKYIIEDVLYLPKVQTEQMAEVSKLAMGRVLAIEFATLPAVMQIRLGGLNFDVDLWESYVQEIETKIQEIKLSILNLLGEKFSLVVQRKKKGETVDELIPLENINWNSTQQMGALMHQLGINVTSTSVTALQEWQEIATKVAPDTLEFIRLLLEFREWSKMSSWDYPKYINPKTGKIHPGIKQIEAATGRMACSSPNLQNVPRPEKGKPNLRNLWIPDSDEYVLICADYSQQEPRVLAHLCQDPRMIEACNGQDVYIEFAKHMYGRTVDKRSEERQYAKVFVLATGYGSGATRLHKASGLPIEECERIKSVIQVTFPGMVTWGRQQYRNLMNYGYCTTAAGRRRYYPDKSKRRYTEALNTPVQGTAADMMKLALAKVYRFLTENQFNARLWLTVHDELEVHAHQSVAEEIMPEIFRLMEEAGKELCPSVLHLAEGRIMRVWDK